MKKPLRPCNKVGCHELTRDTYCTSHMYIKREKEEQRQKEYSKHKRSKTSQSFYNSSAWKRIRSKVMARDLYLCQQCKRDSKITTADVVHHKVEIKRDWTKRLDINNLESLCHACHNKIDHI